MNNYCGNCGNKLNDDGKCDKCSEKDDNVSLIDKERNKAAWLFSIDIMLLCFSIYACCTNFLFAELDLILFASSIVMLVWLKVTYPKIKYIQIWFWIIMISVVILLSFLLVMMMICGNTISWCIESNIY